MSGTKIFLHNKLKPFQTEQTFIRHKSCHHALFPKAEIVKNHKNQLFIQFQAKIHEQKFQEIQEALIILAEMSKYDEIVRMRHLKVKEMTNQNKHNIHISVYLQYVGQSLEKYLRMKRKSKNTLITQDVLFRYMNNGVHALNIIQSFGFQRHGHLSVYTIRLYRQNIKIMFNPLYHLTSLDMLLKNPEFFYFKDSILSPEQLMVLRQQSSDVRISSKADVYCLGIIILNLATLDLYQNSCYLPQSRQNANIDHNNIDEKLAYVTQYYSTQFTKILSSMLNQEEADRIQLLDLNVKIEQILQKRKQKQNKYVQALLRIYKDKKFQSVKYNLSFDKIPKNKAKMEVVKVLPKKYSHSDQKQKPSSSQIPKYSDSEKQINKDQNQDAASVYSRGTFGRVYSQEQDTQKKFYSVQTHIQDIQSTPKKALQKHSHLSQQSQEDCVKELNKQFQYHVSVSPGEIDSFKSNEKGKFKSEVKPNFPIIQEQSNKSFRISEQSPKKDFQSPILSKQIQCEFGNNILQRFLRFEGIPFGFQGEDVPKRKYFQLPKVQQLIKLFASNGVIDPVSRNIYYGQFENGRRHGIGLQVYPEGDYYFGQFQQDSFHGDGVYRWSPTLYWVGNFHYGQKHLGWMINGGKTYYGVLVDNQKNGEGVNFQESQIYKGWWSRGKREGEGIIYYTNGNKFNGVWKSGKKNGLGVETNFQKKTETVGEWKNDQLIKTIEVKFLSYRQVYKSKSKDDQVGKGQQYFKNGDVFSGVYKDGKTYEGTVKYNDGSIYNGPVDKNNKRHGFGTFIYSNGFKYEGQFFHGQRHGKGTATMDSEIFSGLWKKGKFFEGTITNLQTKLTKVVNLGFQQNHN